MRMQKQDLLGLVVGLALGGATLYLVMPRIEAGLMAALRPKPGGQAAAPQTVPPPPVVAQIAPPAAIVAVPVPTPLPSIASPDLPAHPPGGAPSSSAVTSPSQPPDPTGAAGTGFFVADDGSVLTAAHVVADCSRTAIVSQFVQPTEVDVIATDANQDIALLRAPQLHPPAVLPLGRPVSRRLVVLGYPTSADLAIPVETWVTLENDKLPGSDGTLADPREMIWIDAAAVTHGFSGGPIFDPGNGAAVGIVRGTIDGERLKIIRGMPTTGVAVGPGANRLNFFLRQQSPRFETAQSSDTGAAALDDARRATVHVVCWR
jgi:S1-C subfamily serine protease